MTIDTTKLKPFDLERALAGDKVVTRDGRPIAQILFADKAKRHAQVIAIGEQGGILCCRPITGICDSKGFPPYDLFMAPKKKTVYVNIRRDSTNAYWYNNKTVAYDAAESMRYMGEWSAVAVLVEIEV